jgi:transposase InsO family protein
LEDVVEDKHLGVEVADGHIIKCPATGKIKIKMLDDENNPLEVTFHDVMYVPGLSRRLFSITRFVRHGHNATFTKGTTTLQFAPTMATVSIAHTTKATVFAADSTVMNNSTLNYHEVPAFRSSVSRSRQKRLPLELLHARLGHRKCRTLLSANEHQLWKDVSIRMSPETGCLSCGIATARSAARNTEHHSGASQPGEYIFLDIEHPITTADLTTASTYPFYLIVVDAYSRYVRFYGLHNKSTKAVTTALQQYQADNKPAETFGFINLEKIRTDAGSQFTSSEFADYCREQGVHLSLAAPKNQYQNHLAERTWQTTSTMARALLVHARLPNVFWYHALQYASYIFYVLPVRGVKDDHDYPATPHELFFREKPTIAQF